MFVTTVAAAIAVITDIISKAFSIEDVDSEYRPHTFILFFQYKQKVLLTVQAGDLQVEVGDAGEQAPAVGHFHAGIEGGVLEAMQPLQVALQAQAALQALHGPADGGHLRRLQRARHILPGCLQGTTQIPYIDACSVPACHYYCKQAVMRHGCL